MDHKLKYFLYLLFAITLLGCNNSSTNTPIVDLEFNIDLEGNTPKAGDKVVFHETTFLNGKEMLATYPFGPKEIIPPPANSPTQRLPVNYKMLYKMSVGDSVTVRQHLKDLSDLPAGYQPNDLITYKIKLLSISSDKLLAEKKK